MTGRRTSGWSALVAALLVGVALTGCSDGSGDGSTARLELDGRAVLAGDGEAREVEAGSYDVEVGTTVEVVEGAGVVDLHNEASVELRSGRGGAQDSRLQVGEMPTLLAGEALLVAPDTTASVEAGGARLTLTDGAARLGRSTGASFAVYRGEATVASGGRSLDGGLPPLRQVSVPGTGLLPLEPGPLLYDPAQPDPWDRRHLGEAIELGRQLERRSTGFTASLRSGFDPDAAFLQAVLPPLGGEPTFGPPLLDPTRSAGETLVGAGIAVLADDGSLADRWDEVFSFREAGAEWGLVALDQDVSRAPLLGLIDEAVDRSPLLFSVPSGSPVAVDDGLVGRPDGAGRDRVGPGGGAPRPSGPSDPGTEPPPPEGGEPPPEDEEPPPGDPDPGPAPDPPDTDPLLEPLPDPVEDVLDDLLGGGGSDGSGGDGGLLGGTSSDADPGLLDASLG